MKKNNFQKGQSLPEILVALAVVSLVVVALLSAATVAVKNSAFSRNQARATELAQASLEAARKLRDVTDPELFFVNPPPDCGLNKTYDGLFNLVRTCDYIPAGPGNPEYVEVKVEVTWGDEANPHRSSLMTQLTKW